MSGAAIAAARVGGSGVEQRRIEAGVAKQFGDDADIDALAQQAGGDGASQHVRAELGGDSGGIVGGGGDDAWTPTSPDLLGYIGSYIGIADTNTTKLNARYYNPTAGAFTQTDPIGDIAHPGRDNPYTYAGADPINSIYPSGLCSWYDVECDAESVVNTTINYASDALNDVSDTVDNYVSDTASEYIEQSYDAVSGCLAGAVAAEETGAAEVATAFFGPVGAAGASIGGCALGAGLTEEGGEL